MQSKFQIMRANRQRKPVKPVKLAGATISSGINQQTHGLGQRWSTSADPSVTPRYWDQANVIGLGCAHEFGEPPAALGACTPGFKTCRKCGMSGFPGR